jgi:hypothetical protein
MNRPSFFQGCIAALLAGVFGSVTLVTGTMIFSSAFTFHTVIALLGGCYLLSLFATSRHRTGQLTMLCVWLVASIAVFTAGFSVLVQVALQMGLIWLSRSCLFYRHALTSLADLGLQVVSFMAGTWALTQTGSFFLTIWSMFLVQAMFVFLPEPEAKTEKAEAAACSQSDDFNRALRRAENAWKRTQFTNQPSIHTHI